MNLETIIKTCAEPIVAYDEQGRTTYVNPAFEALFGWRSQEVLGQQIDFVPKNQVQATQEATARVMAGETVAGLETRRLTKTGECLDVRLSAARLNNGAGDFSGIVVTLQDITELVRSRRSAKAAAQVKARILSNISHEFRTPMNHVMGMIDLLGQTRLDSDQQTYVEILQTSAESLMGVVNDMLDFSRMETGMVQCQHIGFDLRTLAEKMNRVMAVSAEEKGLYFSLSVHQLVPSLVMGDPGRLRQILMNLFGNALKFTEKGQIEVGVNLVKEDETSSWIRFYIQDTGVGIPREQLGLIFDSFSQADGSATRKYGGTGLGLSISSHLLKMMDSAIEVQSVVGEGSCFSFTLALDKQKKDGAGSLVRQVSLKGKHILVAEENDTERQVLKMLLTDWGCRVTHVKNSQEILTVIQNVQEDQTDSDNSDNGIDAILLGLDLDAEDTTKSLPWMASLPRAKRIKTIVLASVGKPGDANRLGKAGVQGYLPKPVRPPELYGCISTVLAMGTGAMVTRHTLRENKKQQVGILLVEPGLVNQKIAVNVLKKSGYRVRSEACISDAVNTFKSGEFNLVFMDFQEIDGRAGVTALRGFETEKKIKPVPIIAMTANESQVSGAGSIVTDFLTRPFEPAALLAAVEKWTWQNEVFLSDHVQGYSQMQSRKDLARVFDLETALERAMDDKEFLEMLAKEFIGILPKKVGEIKSAKADQELDRLVLACQSLKGSSANMGADQITAAAAALEQMGESRDLGLWDNRIQHLDEACCRFKIYVKDIRWGEV